VIAKGQNITLSPEKQLAIIEAVEASMVLAVTGICVSMMKNTFITFKICCEER